MEERRENVQCNRDMCIFYIYLKPEFGYAPYLNLTKNKQYRYTLNQLGVE
jgi:hypothetical protein